MKTNIREVAKACGVSPYTVSSVINNKRSVKAETRQKVLRTVARMGYAPHARQQVKNDTLGLIMPHMGSISPFYARAIDAFKEECTGSGLNTQLFSQLDIIKKVTATPALGRDNFECSGVIAFSPVDLPKGGWQPWVTALASWGIPLVLIRRPAPVPGIITITNDDENGIRTALSHLQQQGHRRIGLLLPNSTYPFLEGHSKTFREYHEENGLPFDPQLISGMHENGMPRFDAWWHGLTERNTAPTAIICRPDQLANKVIHHLERQGNHVPEDVSVIGFDDDYGDEGMLLPLTTIRIPVEEMISMGVRMLHDHLNGIKTDGADISMPLELKIRESTTNTAEERNADSIKA